MKKNLKSAVIFGIFIFLAAMVGQGTAHGYLHPADPIILLAAFLLPTPYAMIGAGAASLLADLLKGYYLLAPVTLAIKLLMVLAVKGLLRTRPAQKFPELTVSVAALIPVPGYYLSELLYQFVIGKKAAAFTAAAVTLRKDLIQGFAGILLFILLYDAYKGIKNAKEELRKQKEEAEEKKEADEQE